MLTPDQIVKMPGHQRCRLRLQKRYRKYHKQERPRLSSEDLLKFIRDNKIRAACAWDKIRGPTDPTSNDIRREFGSWHNAMFQAHGNGSPFVPKIDGEYVYKAVYQLNLWTSRAFREARRRDPVSIPSWSAIKREWGGYRNLFECARRDNLKLLLEEYRTLYRKLGHVPSLMEIKNANLRMESAIKFYGGKTEMDDFVLFKIGGK